MARTFTDQRPTGWKTIRFWQDAKLWYHPVNPNEPDNVQVYGEIPDWVRERRGQTPSQKPN